MMAYGKVGGRLPDPGMGAICGRCGEPREAHGGPKKLGNCPDQHGLGGRRFSLRDEDKPERTEPEPRGKPNRAIRIYDLAEWERFGELAEPDRSEVLRAFIRWYVGLPDAQLPERPGHPPNSRSDHGISPTDSAT